MGCERFHRITGTKGEAKFYSLFKRGKRQITKRTISPE
jgi:hypothetical protein